MKEIPLSRGLVALVDDEDYEFLMQWKWFASQNHSKFVAERRSGDKHFKMHNVLLPPEPGKSVDHINGDSLDNRKCNLRLATQQEQCWNRRKRPGTRSPYKGVVFHPGTKRWRAQICKNYKQISLGLYSTQEEAARAYDNAAVTLFGQMAKTNFNH